MIVRRAWLLPLLSLFAVIGVPSRGPAQAPPAVDRAPSPGDDESDPSADDADDGLATGPRAPRDTPRRARPLPIDMRIDRRRPIPPAAPFHMGREIAQTMHYTGAPWLVRESRQREEDCKLLLEALGVRPGQTVCDMGAGNGFYTLELARLVGAEGVVYAVDIQPEMLRLLARRAADEGLDNVRLILGTAIDPRLPTATIDMVLCVDVYHEFSHPVAMLERIRESLAPGGRLVLAEFRGEDPAVPIKPLHKMTKAQVRQELDPVGFRLEREFDRLPWQHLLFFGVADAP
ncbi:MAG: class I SAM-dependent methyltransferase [Planctomycetaceae bacterium]